MIVSCRSRASHLAVLLVLWAVVPGCGDGKPPMDTSLTEATVTGTVTAKGEPVTGGTILFNPSNAGRHVETRTAQIGPDGRYSLKTYTGDNLVTYEGEVAKKYSGVGLRKDSATVEAGENTFDFDVLGAGSKNAAFDLSKKGQRKKR